MNIVIKALLTLAVVLTLVLIGSWFYMDRIVYQAIVRVGPQVTGTSIELEDVSIQPLSGELSLRGLNVGNPEGFVAPYVFSLGGIDLAIDTSTLREPVLVIKNLTIDEPHINYEATSQGDNLRTLQANIARNTGADESAVADDTEQGGGRKIVIESLSIRAGQISVSHYLLANEVVNVDLPELQMTNLGAGSGGATVAEVASQILEYLSQQAYQAAIGSERLNSVLEDVQGQVQDRLRELEDENGVLEEVGERARGLLNSLGR